MKAYFFTVVATRSQLRTTVAGPQNYQTQDDCTSRIVFAETLDAARQQFDAWMQLQPDGDNPIQTEIIRITSAQFVDQMFTESGNMPIVWPAIFQQFQKQLESTPVDDFEQGYWVDMDPLVRSENVSATIEDLQRDLPEDISSGLNWMADKQFFFLLSVLTPPPPPIDFTIPLEPGAPEPEDADASNGEDSDSPDPVELQNLLATFPQAADKEAAAVVQARNSVAAGWVWRHYAAGKQVAALPIRIDPWCETLGFPGPGQDQGET